MCGRQAYIKNDRELSDNPKRSPSLSKRRVVFRALVRAQDSGVGDTEAYFFVANLYNLDIGIVRKIAFEGVSKDWPME